MATTGRPVTGGREHGELPPEARDDAAEWPDGDGRISPGLADALVHRLFTAGLDLHAALTCIEADMADEVTIGKICKAIDGLDGAIRDFRTVVVNLHSREGTYDGLRSLIIEAVERACAPGETCPAITLGHGLETVIGPPAWQRVARLVHRALILLPRGCLGQARVAVTADPRPPVRMVLQIDAPDCALNGVAGRLRVLNGSGTGDDAPNVSCEALPQSPECSRMRLEWPVAVR